VGIANKVFKVRGQTQSQDRDLTS